ncbi:MAG: aldo/keto reductase [Chloroflexi bacterium]|nr:aldo/keto reductase [Chloroflexota bacterium]
MRYKKMGRTGLKVSELCLGCMTFGGQADEETSFAIMNTALEAGCNFFDTANVYTEGRSEQIVGRWLKGRRESVILATKARAPVGKGPNDSGVSRKHIMRAVEDSLRRLQTDYIDLYQVHSWDPDTPIEETLRALDDLVRAGKVRYIGCSNFAAWQLCKALWVSDARNLARFDCLQPRYNLIFRDIEEELLPLCAAEGVGIIVYNPLAGGFLSGKYTRDQEPPGGTRFALRRDIYWKRYWHDRHFDAVDRLKEIASSHGKSIVPFAVAWTLRSPVVTAAIVGATSVAQLQESLGGFGMSIGPEEMSACDEVWGFLRGR